MKHVVRATAVAVAAACLAPLAGATSGVIPAPGRVDFAYDTSHHVLYISGTDQLLRFDVAHQRWLAPLTLGGKTMGLDLSADGRFLAVANASTDGSQNWVDVVSLKTLGSQRLRFPLDFYEGGTWAVAFDAAGQLLVTSQFNGSGWVPLRKVDPATGVAVMLGSVRQNSMVSPSADHRFVAITESNVSSGPYGRYATGDTSYASTFATSWFTYEIAISPDGKQMAVPTYGGTFIHDPRQSYANVGTYAGAQPIAAAYAPTGHRVFFPFAESAWIAEYDSTTMTELRRIPVPTAFGWTGNRAFGEGRTKVSSDGSLVCSTVSGGVFCADTAAPATPR